jgi:protease-4
MHWKFWKHRQDEMPATDDPAWERALINKMAAEFLREQRRMHRWGVIFKVGILLYLLVLVGAYYAKSLTDSSLAPAITRR